MENTGVKCDVCECIHNCCSNKCKLDTIEITHISSGEKCVSTPHFCKSYQSK